MPRSQIIARESRTRTYRGRPASLYYTVVPVDGTPKWETVEPSVAGRPATRKDAETSLAKRLKDLHDGKLRVRADLTFAAFSQIWLEDYARAEVAPPHARHLPLPLQEEHLSRDWLQADRRAQVVQRFKASLSHLSAETVRKHLSLLRQMFNHAIEWGYCVQNPARKVRLPTVRRRRVKPWNPAELRQFLNAVPEDWYAYFLCVVSGGLRVGESLAMRWRNLDWEGGRYHVKESVRRDGGPSKNRHLDRLGGPDARGDQGARSPQSPPERTEDRGRGDTQDLIFCTRYGKLLHDRNVVNRIYLPSISKGPTRGPGGKAAPSSGGSRSITSATPAPL